MKIGISDCSLHFADDPRTGAQHMIERTAAASAAGLDSLFVGDHHVTAAPYYQNNVILACMLDEWGSKPFGVLYLLPLWHPVLLAEQIGTLASTLTVTKTLNFEFGIQDREFGKSHMLNFLIMAKFNT
jgi:alkanesulfonate monooxygenase SsuD/methylene tetrahydromethanopterin reductase-like flavin-dependent oxidoreductase (luciferase family)